ncbi:MAG: homocysteine S-methyltransferase family protein [Planctomycetota bacterium]
MSDRLNKLIARIASGKMVLGDGALGTQLQRAGLAFGDCPEEWNVSHPDAVRCVASEYIAAGADFCMTNTFGANRYRLMRHGYADRLREFNVAGVRLSREAAERSDAVVIASVGPTGEFVQPEGMLSAQEMRAAYREQMNVLKEAGADAVCIETMYVAEEAALAVEAAKEVGLYCIASVTFDSTKQGFKTMVGASIREAVEAVDRAGADVIGSNCGNGIAEMTAIAREMRPLTRKPLLIKSNAGMPEMIDGNAVYNDTPETMSGWIQELKTVGVSIIGGCCGTTPEHIRRFREEIQK